MEILSKVHPCEMCPECEVLRTPRSKHCAICNRCVERFDHHCPWINNCVGVGNHNTFLAYITFQYGLLVLTSVGGVYSIIQRAQNHHQNDDFLPFLLS
jgi:hypothetical protein